VPEQEVKFLVTVHKKILLHRYILSTYCRALYVTLTCGTKQCSIFSAWTYTVLYR